MYNHFNKTGHSIFKESEIRNHITYHLKNENKRFRLIMINRKLEEI